MYSKFSLSSLAIACMFSFTLSLVALENSVLQTIQQIESLENLPRQKYSTNQYKEISNLLDKKAEKIRLVSYNILFNLYDDHLDEVNRWPQRLPRIAALIEEMQPDILNVQELYHDQLEGLTPYLDNSYAFYSKPCEDGELNGIFYRKDRFDVVDSHVWYMTTTPDVPSSETLTSVTIKDRLTDKIVTVLNAHMAFSKIDKREFQARFIADKVKELAKTTPVIFSGDLNTFPNRFDLEKLPFYDGDYIHRLLTEAPMRDARELAVLGHVGPLSTFTNTPDIIAPFIGLGTPGVFLDHVYVTNGLDVLVHAVESGTVEGHYPSDHLPILVDFLVE